MTYGVHTDLDCHVGQNYLVYCHGIYITQVLIVEGLVVFGFWFKDENRTRCQVKGSEMNLFHSWSPQKESESNPTRALLLSWTLNNLFSINSIIGPIDSQIILFLSNIIVYMCIES